MLLLHPAATAVDRDMLSLRTPWRVRSWYDQRQWENRIRERGTLPMRYRVINWIAHTPLGGAAFVVVCVTFIGFDVLGTIVNTPQVRSQMEQQQNEQRRIRDMKTEQVKERLEKQQEVLQTTRAARDGNWAAAQFHKNAD